jgi:outer membrane protein
MKTSLKTLFSVAAFSAATLFAQAQPALKVAVVDIGKIFEGHHEFQEQQEKLKGLETKVQEELARMAKEGTAQAEKFKELDEQSKNPVLTAEARKAAEGDAQKQLSMVRKAEQDFNQYRNEVTREIQQNMNSFQQLLIEKISKVATEVAKKKGATILVGKGATIYVDPAFDITEEVVAEIARTRPAGSTPAAAPAAAKPGEAPGVSFPGTKK